MPHRALTTASVERIKPPPKGQIEHFDKGYPGLALRVSYGGGKSFVYFYRIGGKLRRMTLGTFPALTLAAAREAWRAAREDVSKGRDPSTTRVRDSGVTDFQSVSTDWLKRDQEKNRSHDEVARVVKRELIPKWGHRQIKDIGRRDILDLIDGIADRGKLTMARRVQAYVHRLFKWAVERGILDSNPASDLPKPGREIRRDRVLTDGELKKIWLAATKLGWPFGAGLQLLILTGARREEIGHLRWSEVEETSLRLAGDRTKNGEPHLIPLSQPAISIFKGLPRINGLKDFVFTTTGDTAVSGWSKIKTDIDAEIKIEPWRIHDLRRTVSTGMNELGVEPHIVEAILGHTVKGVAGVYNRAKYETAKRAALEAWGEHVMVLVEASER